MATRQTAVLHVRCEHCGKTTEFVPRGASASDDSSEDDDSQHARNPRRSSRGTAEVGAVDELRGIPGADGLLNSVRHDVQRTWIEIYPQAFIRAEITKAALWLKNNPTRQKKLIGRFLTSWLDRANLNRPFGAYQQEEKKAPVELEGEVNE